ncbi:MAG: hypothetical protein ACP5G7_05565 [Anaerolineae bacterium]
MTTDEKAKAYVVFFGLPKDTAQGIMTQLGKMSERVAFVGGEAISYLGKKSLDYARQIKPDLYVSDERNRAVLREIDTMKDDLDGLILFYGRFSDERFLLSGLPTLLVDYNAFPTLQLGFKNAVAIARRNQTRFLTATWSDTDVSSEVRDRRLADFAAKIELFRVLHRIKGTRILDVQTEGFGSEPHEHWWRLDQEKYLHQLNEALGIDAVIADYRDLFDAFDGIAGSEAEGIARRWIDEAEAVKDGRSEADVLEAARLYLATKELMARYDANAITLDCMTWHLMGGRYDVCGSPGLTEFQKDLVPAIAESDMDGLVTAVVGNHLTGRPGFQGDFMIDVFNDVTVYAHCQAPINPYGNDSLPYTIREHMGRTVLQVKMPTEGEITALRVNVLANKISVHTGELIDGTRIYRDFIESSCRSKLVAKVNAGLIHDNYDYRTFTNHPVVYLGDFRQEFKDLARFIGYEVIEEDR